MNESDKNWEQKINALLDGELNKADAEDLKTAATDDRELARAIVGAHQLQQIMDGIQLERVPANLAKRLRVIPRKQRSKPAIRLFQPRWAMALAAVPLAVIIYSLMQPEVPSDRDIAQARQELAIAFSYLDKAGVITGREIE